MRIFYSQLIFIFIYASILNASPYIEFPFFFFPESPGASSIGIGGATAGSSDNSTRIYPNPGLILNEPEFSVNFKICSRNEKVRSGRYPEMYSNRITDNEINYWGVVYPSRIFNKNMLFSISYRTLHDFERDWFIGFNEQYFENDSVHYIQTGGLSAISFSYCLQLFPNLFAGASLNVSKDSLSKNQWSQNYHFLSYNGEELNREYLKKEIYTFSGQSINIGFLWRTYPTISFGGIIKFSYTADIQHKTISKYLLPDSDAQIQNKNENLRMPMTYAIGVSYKYSDQLFYSMDIYYTQWNDFMYKDALGNKRSPISGKLFNDSETEPTCQIRTGIEYRYINRQKEYIIPLRAGFFYDPAPTTGCPDKIWGLSLGIGLTFKHFSVDTSCQYRFGNNIGQDLFDDLNLDFSERLRELKIYTGIIVYASNFFNKRSKK